ncbi:DUF4249 domain-containing protein [Aurantibacter sp.]|uniref:DUF4249 domain-containing protein n=1 Tax=Aurantibacter sp. TaxID=2807103 RepID=UPI003264DD80
MKKYKVTYYISTILFVLIGCLFSTCTEPYSPNLLPQTESLLVVEAVLTNELKNHEVILSRSSAEQGEIIFEQNATVKITDDNQQTYTFSEVEVGKYISDIAFKAELDKSYQLFINTSTGKAYSSSSVSLPQSSQIESINSVKTTTQTGNIGVSIAVNSYDPTGNSIYYRYDYEETYKIIAPNWIPEHLIVASEEEQVVSVVNRENEERVCYATDYSNSILLTETSGTAEDRVSNFEVRFLNQENYIFSHRYSILIRQHVLSQQAYNFYKKLQDFSGSESLFSQSQPGFINGNIYSEDNNQERVVGIFEVSSVSEKRAFINYADFYPEEDLPPYIDDCDQTTYPVSGEPSVYQYVKANSVSYVDNITNAMTGALEAYIIAPRVCGDCTVLGSAEVPEFWIE